MGKLRLPLLIFALASLGACTPLFECERETLSSVASPLDPSLRLEQTLVRCGATTRDVLWVDLRQVADKPDDTPLAVLEYDAASAPYPMPTVRAVWDAHRLTLEVPPLFRVFRADEKWNGYQIELRPLPSA